MGNGCVMVCSACEYMLVLCARLHCAHIFGFRTELRLPVGGVPALESCGQLWRQR